MPGTEERLSCINVLEIDSRHLGFFGSPPTKFVDLLWGIIRSGPRSSCISVAGCETARVVKRRDRELRRRSEKTMASLRSLEVELEAVTPLWIGGASRQAELRPPSVRGCLRFWFRALAGGLLGEELRTVCEAESAVFGNTTRALSVVVRLFGSPRTGVSVVGETEQLPGLAYMFWSVLQQGAMRSCQANGSVCG